MPNYCFVNDDGEKLELSMPIAQYERRVKNGVLRHKGQKWRVDFSAFANRSRELQHVVATNPGNYPMKCESLAVDPENIRKRIQEDQRLGVGGTEYTKGGTPIMRDKRHYKKYRQAYKVRFNNGFES